MSIKEIFTIHPLLTDKNRLAIMVFLQDKNTAVDFNSLLKNLKLTKGNLSSHLKKLEEAKLISVIKEFIGRKPRSSYKVTAKGKKSLLNYLEVIENTISRIKF